MSSGRLAANVYGDLPLRKTVGLPRTLPELNNEVRAIYGSRGRYRVWAHDTPVEITHNHHFQKHCNHNDTVVVTFEDSKPEDMGPTSYQCDFIKHPLPEGHKAAPPDTRRPQKPFEGDTTYASHYIRHPLGRPDPAKRIPSSIYFPQDGDAPASTYDDHYPWKEGKPERPRPDEKPYKPRPFEGNSCYNTDFVKKPFDRAVPVKGDGFPAPKMPFDGSTTYTDDFKNRPGEVPKANKPEPREKRDLPFEGISEYKHEYLKKENERKMQLHIAPEHPVSKATRRQIDMA